MPLVLSTFLSPRRRPERRGRIATATALDDRSTVTLLLLREGGGGRLDCPPHLSAHAGL